MQSTSIIHWLYSHLSWKCHAIDLYHTPVVQSSIMQMSCNRPLSYTGCTVIYHGNVMQSTSIIHRLYSHLSWKCHTIDLYHTLVVQSSIMKMSCNRPLSYTGCTVICRAFVVTLTFIVQRSYILAASCNGYKFDFYDASLEKLLLLYNSHYNCHLSYKGNIFAWNKRI